jgi:hypothetical protein
MSESVKADYRRRALEEDLPELREVKAGRSMISYLSGPDGMIIEVTQSNAYAVEALLAHAHAEQYPDLFPDFDPAQTPLPAHSEVLDSTGGPFGSINEWEA